MKAVVIHAAHDLRVEDFVNPPMGAGDVEVKITNGGICGSDLHYYHDGGFGTVRVREKMALGHEIAGVVSAVGANVRAVKPGDRVAVNPSRPCNACRFCLAGEARHCTDMLFFGSAMRFPHVQGGFREALICTEAQAVKLPEGVALERAAFAEPLSVCLHAANRAGQLQGRRVLVTGAGPIGALCVMVARHAGAREVVATDISDAPLAIVRKIGADLALNTRSNPDALAPFAADKGQFDVVFECSGSPLALAAAINVARPGAVVVQVGIGGEIPVPLNVVVGKEIQMRGSFRFDVEFDWAVKFLSSGAIDVAPLLTEILPMDQAVRAFDLASDRSKAMKVQLSF